MRKIFSILTISIFIFSCTSVTNQELPKDKIVGNDLQNGCKGSAGYQWSKIKNECIRPFEEGVKLNPVNNSNYASYLILNNDQIEVFSVEFSPSEIFKKQNTGIWKNGKWRIELKNGVYSLINDGKVVYTN